MSFRMILFDRVFLEIGFRGCARARAEVSCATDKISVGNIHTCMVKHSLDSAWKISPECIANSYLTNPYNDVFYITLS
jgi:hypothetical protein